ncbi:unnamed protein product [Lepeophtheirus salmonis]|uniref:(salmon louse) hypothetical protein n=1 Tax=Lepeophtheirus salmonis TaxID=72036 RepID=A0A7R8HBQ0_LEPSM|nr:unnamed protein product [Lepeophtheirus salmonis]CAF2998707.1 unnamed protein product [Lepeophtheirus salmonis]
MNALRENEGLISISYWNVTGNSWENDLFELDLYVFASNPGDMIEQLLIHACICMCMYLILIRRWNIAFHACKDMYLEDMRALFKHLPITMDGITQEIASICSMHGTTTRKDIFMEVQKAMQDYNLQWNQLRGVTDDGGKNIAEEGCDTLNTRRVIPSLALAHLLFVEVRFSGTDFFHKPTEEWRGVQALI